MYPGVIPPVMGKSVSWFVMFYGLSTLVGYLIPDPLYIYIYIYIYSPAHWHNGLSVCQLFDQDSIPG